ncbi:zinc finger CCHC-type and RNA-binding motif-containing protein 1-like [Anopheles darlingi]|uniref:zinc finger CCHC-type and RNA-binding motif-containing protein 1-like n=1 Tax=Anopheles darlingi TaxID=43151 RepID=UPI0021000103|nr:zinc finger CCHC-type and RNA-binding motif-containing protein 1-like [Anopheles darlingi]
MEKRKKLSVPDVRCTAYISNLPFNLTNIDVNKIFATYGKIIKVTILRDKMSRKSKGVAFILYSTPQEALNCCNTCNNKEMFGRTLKASIAKDNGKGAENAVRKNYSNKTRCFECGSDGHMSYSCPNNVLGSKTPPRKAIKSGKRKQDTVGESYAESGSDSDRGSASNVHPPTAIKRLKYRKSSYFSDDEELDDGNS